MGDVAIGGTGSEKEADRATRAIVYYYLAPEAGDIVAHGVEVCALVDAHGEPRKQFAHAIRSEALPAVFLVCAVLHEVVAEEVGPWLVLQFGAEGEEEMAHEDVEGVFYFGDFLLGGETSENGGLGGSWGLGVPLKEMHYGGG